MLRTNRTLAVLALLASSALFIPATASAQSQAVNFNVGFFVPKGEDSRITDDVLVADLSDFDPLLFDIADFRSASVGAEWLIGLGTYAEAGLGASFSRRTVPSIYANTVHEDEREIEQDLKLRVAPITATVRFFPLGRHYGVQPYVGGGVALLNWRYSETGEFVDPSDQSIFRNTYVESGSDVGAVFLGGLRFPVSRKFWVGGEFQYQQGEGDLPVGGVDGFLGSKIDLGGWRGNFTMTVGF